MRVSCYNLLFGNYCRFRVGFFCVFSVLLLLMHKDTNPKHTHHHHHHTYTPHGLTLQHLLTSSPPQARVVANNCAQTHQSSLLCCFFIMFSVLVSVTFCYIACVPSCLWLVTCYLSHDLLIATTSLVIACGLLCFVFTVVRYLSVTSCLFFVASSFRCDLLFATCFFFQVGYSVFSRCCYFFLERGRGGGYCFTQLCILPVA